jgi:tRNA 5-methylaminomethyl-2-thiouridine biosynthesis bifunctional protein
VAVLANAMGVPALLRQLPQAQALARPRAMHAVAGQLDYYALPAGLAPRVILAGDGYCLPAVEGINVAGSTYVPHASSCAASAAGSREILDKLGALLDRPGGELAGLRHPALGWTGWRAVAAGRMPLIGPVAGLPGLWLACAYGSRGLTWSALAGDVVAAGLNGEPAPVERELLRAVAVC